MSDTDTAAAQYNKMTKTPVQKLILTLSVPTILSMMVTNIYNLVDTAFVGKLGNSASGAVGVVFGFMAILQAVGFMFGNGSGSMVARKLGQKNPEEASRIASTGFFCSFFGGILLSLLGFIFINPLINILGSTDTIAPYAKIYIRCILTACPFVVSSFTLNNLLRYEGKARLGMIGLLAGGILNIGGDALFMFYFNMGIFGAGLSTAISQVISFCILLSMFLCGRTECKLSIHNFTFENDMFWEITATGFPSMLRQGLSSLSTVLMNFQAAKYAGDAGVAAMSIVGRVAFFLFAVALGIGQGFQPVCGFNYGAKKYKRLRDAYKFTTHLSICVLLAFTIVALIFSGDIIQIFRDDSDVIRIGTRALILQSLAQLLLPFTVVTEMTMQSCGQKAIASFLSSLRGGFIFLPAILLLPMWRGISGIQEAQPLSFLLTTIPALLFANNFFSKLPSEDMPD